MTLQTYAQKIAELAKKHPTALVVHSSDDEGNSFTPVIYAPTAGKYSKGQFNPNVKTVNSVCVN